MNTIGAFNQNHDGPKWEFVERPDVAVNMLPATWSNPGFGFYGKTHTGNWTISLKNKLIRVAVVAMTQQLKTNSQAEGMLSVEFIFFI